MTYLKPLGGAKMYDLVLKNGKIFLNHELVNADLAIKDEKIAAIGQELEAKHAIELAGKWVLPGLIDAHTHLSLPFRDTITTDDFYTGSIAGAKGGVTTFIDFTAQQGDEGLVASLNRRKAQAQNQAGIDYSFHACISKFSKGVREDLPKLLSEGINSLKVFMAYPHMMLPDNELFELMKLCAEHGVLLTVHAENGTMIEGLIADAEKKGVMGIKLLPELRPEVTEATAIKTLGTMSQATGCPVYVVHISSGLGAAALVGERGAGAHIAGETCPQYLFLDNSLLAKEDGHYFSCCPPLRARSGQGLLWDALKSEALSVVATDHCPFNRADKDSWEGCISNLPMGLPGIESFGELILSEVQRGVLSLQTAIKTMSEAPARIFGMFPQKGSLRIGTDADIMVYDPEPERVLTHKEMLTTNDYTVYEGFKVKGQTHLTILRGKPIYSQEAGWMGKEGGGRFLKRAVVDSSFFNKKRPEL